MDLSFTADRLAVRGAGLDLPEDLRRSPCGDRPRGRVAGDDGVRADHAVLADLGAAGDDDARAEPAVGADPRGTARGESRPGDRQFPVVEAVVGGADEAVFG